MKLYIILYMKYTDIVFFLFFSLFQDVEAFEDDNKTLRVENRALINAFSQLSTTV